jgi:hypothetical protein
VAEVDRYAATEARANLVLNSRIEAHRVTARQFPERTAVAALVVNLLTGDRALTADQLADCLAIAIQRIIRYEDAEKARKAAGAGKAGT